ncbi:caspase family protein [Singulisphaera acidiphila]|uniref:Caspase domain-containing protein n=1 Tax=Singulisphaera acidiphila (strain ATCC BAA-1392 / DSM 18658 / VKM B-2454 / MOB10) TaxID=886293 RepID=L0DGI7_SINAD|nr:caspase family protein [Singulisphaera acidiphila]AGA27965.1 Caspase domain-containing protein [Singulisphaera acidiphila DSM 18658]
MIITTRYQWAIRLIVVAIPLAAWTPCPGQDLTTEAAAASKDDALSETEPVATRGDRRLTPRSKAPSTGGIQYRKRWALVVGINYKATDRETIKDGGTSRELKNAENDALAVAELLKAKYGYGQDGALELLLGKQATKEEISKRLGQGLLGNTEEVHEDDSVVFYFSGHGERGAGPADEKRADGHPGFLLPIDFKRLKVGEREELFETSAIDLAEVVRLLNKCPARHKLLILDCCHSGTVFQIQVTGAAGGQFEHQDNDPTLFGERSLQAVTASRDLASDGQGQDKNSPFTRSLLRALNAVPPKLPRNRYYFTTNQLFHAMRAYLDGNLPPKQSPQCRWLDDERSGEFHFFPDPGASFVEEVSRESRQLLLAMVPSTFGNWWADEMPWFMPGLRLEILKDKLESRSMADEIDKDKLREAARQSVRRLEGDGHLSAPLRMRLNHLKTMLQLDQQKDRNGQMHSVVKTLKASVETTGKRDEVEAVDLHYLAVLQHKLGDHAEAQTNYIQALQRYEAEEKISLLVRPLRALCLLDLGMLELTVLNDYAEAFRRFTEAESMFGLGSPAPFKVYCLSKQADSLRRDGITGPAERRMDDAIQLTEAFDPKSEHPLTASAWKYYAWACMEQWKFPQAAEKFTRAGEILSLPANLNRDECSIDRFHIDHGLAMIHRFQGRDDLALEAYRTLTPALTTALTELEARKVEVSNFAEVRSLLYDRLVNSLERQADCSMFGRDPNYAEAADDYRRALLKVDQIPKATRDQVRKDLLYRRAIALSLQDLHAERRTEVDAARPSASILQLARHLRTAADAIGSKKSDPLKVSLSAALAHACPGGIEQDPKAPAGAPQPNLSDLCKLLEELRETSRDFDRDELERLMFAYKFLIELETPESDPFLKIEYADMLLRLCQSAIHRAAADPDVLKYLRPYYDVAFLAKAKYQPDRVKELIELVWEATTGTPYHKPKTIRPVLALYLAGGRCHLLLDPSRGTPTMFALDRSAEDLRRASQSQWALSCPEDLQRALRRLDLKADQKVLLIWRDPVEGIGTRIPSPSLPGLVERPTAEKPITISTALEDAPEAVFPFDLRSSFYYQSTPEQVIEDIASVKLPPKPDPHQTAAGPSTRSADQPRTGPATQFKRPEDQDQAASPSPPKS